MGTEKYQKLVLFDIDGTLIAGKHGHAKSYSDAIKAIHNIDFEVDWRGVQGMTDQQILTECLLKKGISKEIIQENMDKYMIEMEKSFNKSIADNSIYPLEGVKELIIRLKSGGVFLGLVTGNLVSIAQTKLEKLNLWKYFDVGGFGSDDIDRTNLVKLAIRRAEKNFNFKFDNNVFLFGDAPQDIKAAKDAGVQAIGVTTGIYSKEDLSKQNPDYILEDLTDIKRILAIVFPRGV